MSDLVSRLPKYEWKDDSPEERSEFARGQAIGIALDYLNPHKDLSINKSLTYEQIDNVVRALEQLMDEYHNPYLKMIEPTGGDWGRAYFKRGKYDAPDTLGIPAIDKFNNLIAELAHAKQYIESSSVRDSLRRESRRQKALFGEGVYDIMAQKGSGKPTVEYQAHEIIEPEINQRFLDLLESIERENYFRKHGWNRING